MNKTTTGEVDVCPKCGGQIIMVEYGLMDKYHYDGVSEYACVNAHSNEGSCNWRIGRWCEQELRKNEVEPPFCKGREKHPSIHILNG